MFLLIILRVIWKRSLIFKLGFYGVLVNLLVLLLLLSQAVVNVMSLYVSGSSCSHSIVLDHWSRSLQEAAVCWHCVVFIRYVTFHYYRICKIYHVWNSVPIPELMRQVQNDIYWCYIKNEYHWQDNVTVLVCLVHKFLKYNSNIKFVSMKRVTIVQMKFVCYTFVSSANTTVT